MSLIAAAAALKSGQGATGVVTEAIAESKVLGAKPKSYVFHSTVAGNSIASGTFVAGNVNMQVLQNNDMLGNLQDSTAATHFAFDSVKGYAVVTNDLTNPMNSISYTRACDFTPDSKGNLRNSAGQYLMGWKLDESTQDIPTGTNTNLITSLEIINVQQVSGTFTATQNMDIRVNLPTGAATGTVYDVVTRCIDSQGSEHNVTMNWTKTAVANQWALSITSADASAVTRADDGNAYSGATSVLVNFDTNGLLVSFDGDPTATNANIVWTQPGLATTNLTFDFGGVGTQNACRIGGAEFSNPTNSDDGRSYATVERTYIDPEGNVSTIFRNSSSLNIYRIAVANFNAVNFLEPKNGNSFTATNLSGNYVLGEANKGGNAAILAGKVESNPVNLSEQLVKLIELQQYTSAVVKTIEANRNIGDRIDRI